MRREGFTLLELAIVLSIIVILILITIPSFVHYTNQEIEVYARELAEDLVWARFSAINNGVYYKVEFWPGKMEKKWEYRIIEGNGMKVVKKGIFQNGVHILNVNFPGWGNEVYFYPNGSPSSGGTVTIWMKSGNIIYVKIEPVVGRVRVTREDN